MKKFLSTLLAFALTFGCCEPCLAHGAVIEQIQASINPEGTAVSQEQAAAMQKKLKETAKKGTKSKNYGIKNACLDVLSILVGGIFGHCYTQLMITLGRKLGREYGSYLAKNYCEDNFDEKNRSAYDFGLDAGKELGQKLSDSECLKSGLEKCSKKEIIACDDAYLDGFYKFRCSNFPWLNTSLESLGLSLFKSTRHARIYLGTLKKEERFF